MWVGVSARWRVPPALLVLFAHFAISPFGVLPLFLFFLFPACATAATVVTVIDGDTVQLSDGKTVRYLGVNTPEYGQPFHDEAKRFNARLVSGQPIRLETRGRERDRYGRELAYVFVEDVLVNAQIVAEGWGHVFLLEPLARAKEWLPLQQSAQNQHKGIWRDGLPGSLKITTVHANAKGNDRRNPDGEYLRLCNVSDQSVALQGFSVQDAAQHRFIFPSGTLTPGATALLVSGAGKNSERRGQLVFYWGSGPIWNNDGDSASLFTPSGQRIDTFRVFGAMRK